MTYFGPSRRHAGEPFHSTIYDFEVIGDPVYFDTKVLDLPDDLISSPHFSEPSSPTSSCYHFGIKVDREISNVRSDLPESSHLSQRTIPSPEEMSSSDSQNLCKICKEFFPSERGRKNHEKSCTMKYDCDSCGHVVQRDNFEKAINFKQLVSDHERKCKKNYACKNCNEVLSTRWSLKRHVENNMCTSENSVCDICMKVFSSKRAVSVHKRKCH